MAGTRAGAVRAEQRQCQSLMRMRKGVSQQQEHGRERQSKERRSEIRQTESEERHEVRSADRSDGACREACMSVREATNRKTAD